MSRLETPCQALGLLPLCSTEGALSYGYFSRGGALAGNPRCQSPPWSVGHAGLLSLDRTSDTDGVRELLTGSDSESWTPGFRGP